VKAIVAGLVLAVVIAACAKSPGHLQTRMIGVDKKNEITALWTQIRDWRREGKMEVEPPTALVQFVRDKTVRQAQSVCPTHVPPPSCSEICDLAGAICDNAESICEIADELAGDAWAREKCDSAKASCKEATQRCCDCEPLGAGAGGELQ
jgi:hypothetical protein